MKRFLILAALALATTTGATNSASAAFINITFEGLDLTAGYATADPINSVTIAGVTSTDRTATATDLDGVTPDATTFKIENGETLVSLVFNTPLTILSVPSVPGYRGYAGNASSGSFDPAVLPAGSMITSIVLSLSTSNYNPGAQTGKYAGTITVNFIPVPEPASALLLGMGVAGLGAIRSRRLRSRLA